MAPLLVGLPSYNLFWTRNMRRAQISSLTFWRSSLNVAKLQSSVYYAYLNIHMYNTHKLLFKRKLATLSHDLKLEIMTLFFFFFYLLWTRNHDWKSRLTSFIINYSCVHLVVCTSHSSPMGFGSFSNTLQNTIILNI